MTMNDLVQENLLCLIISFLLFAFHSTPLNHNLILQPEQEHWNILTLQIN